ncbi:MAG: 3-deoxy-manno-octulosonate cytidylyltransferase [Verrucomicrobiota bacterium]
MGKTVIAVIPARYASTRFPGKPLAMLKGKPLIEWVWRRAKESKKIARVLVATDDARIADAVKKFGGEVKMTSAKHPSGTDRIAEAVRRIQADWIINLQGDEPLIMGKELDAFISQFGKEKIATMARKIDVAGEENNPNVVKVVFDAKKRALYFSRSPIPFRRDADIAVEYWHHLGIYAYTPEILKKIVKLPPSSLEKIEKLEQLRFLENGIAIRVIPTTLKSVGVDTPEDIQRVESFLP